MDPTTDTDAAFTVWMRKVDAAVQSRAGLSAYDLPDYCYRDAFDDGETPAATARAAIRAANDY